jgi:hypothetical protein
MRAKPRSHIDPSDKADRAGKYLIAFVILSINYALISALDLAELNTLPWLLLAYRASVFLVLYA